MAVAVIGCGRSGTNLILEILRGNSHLVASKQVENKKFCSSGKIYEKNYLTKCDTHYITVQQFKDTMLKNEHLRVVWTIRDPRDMILSKIKRGQPSSQGGDGADKVSDDATPEGAVASIMHMMEIYRTTTQFSERVIIVRMEDVIQDIEKETRRICEFLGIPLETNMLDFVPRMRNQYKRKRYKSLDKGQVALWKNWPTIYDGFFTKNKYPIEETFLKVAHLVNFFGY